MYIKDRDVLKLNSLLDKIGMPPIPPEAFEPAGFTESFAEEAYWPIMGTINAADYLIDLYKIAKRVQDGEGTPQDEKRLIEHWATTEHLRIRAAHF